MTTTVAQQPTATQFVRQLALQYQKQLTGQLNVRSPNGEQWSLYFCVGRLIWATNHSHPVRCLRRQITRYCPKVDFDRLAIRESDRFFCWNYQVVWLLYKRSTISKDAAVAIIENTVTDTLFDILQQERDGAFTFDVIHHEALAMLRMQIAALNLKTVLKKAKQALQQWNAAGLKNISPNAMPILKNLDQLEAHTSPKVYQQLVKKVNGHRTLQELADAARIDCLRLTKSLLPYFQKGWVGFSEAPEFPRPNARKQPPSPDRAEDRRIPLIACVDDSPQICQQLERIIKQAGYRFVGITDSVQALPVLLEKQPKLIFIDLVMPVANGYEVCTQLRRMSQFQKTPIVILTGNDGVIDRVRAKMVKASEFLSKPIDADKVIDTVKRFVEVST